MSAGPGPVQNQETSDLNMAARHRPDSQLIVINKLKLIYKLSKQNVVSHLM